MVISIEQNMNHMRMAVSVYGYGRGGKCVYIFRDTYAGICT